MALPLARPTPLPRALRLRNMGAFLGTAQSKSAIIIIIIFFFPSPSSLGRLSYLNMSGTIKKRTWLPRM